MTSRGDAARDSRYDEQSANLSAPQIVEITAVIGLFDFFNRFAEAPCIPVTR